MKNRLLPLAEVTTYSHSDHNVRTAAL